MKEGMEEREKMEEGRGEEGGRDRGRREEREKMEEKRGGEKKRKRRGKGRRELMKSQRQFWQIYR